MSANADARCSVLLGEVQRGIRGWFDSYMESAGLEMTLAVEGRFDMVRSSQREVTKLKKWASSELVVAYEHHTHEQHG
jgi:hypothetical protein